MPPLAHLLSTFLRIAEISFAAIVAGIIGHFLYEFELFSGDWIDARWIYTEVIAGISIVLGLILVIPFATSFFAWPLDILIALAWFAAFGILVDGAERLNCDGNPYWVIFLGDSFCDEWKAAEAFCFLSGVAWIVSGLVGVWYTYLLQEAVAARGSRRRWASRSLV